MWGYFYSDRVLQLFGYSLTVAGVELNAVVGKESPSLGSGQFNCCSKRCENEYTLPSSGVPVPSPEFNSNSAGCTKCCTVINVRERETLKHVCTADVEHLGDDGTYSSNDPIKSC